MMDQTLLPLLNKNKIFILDFEDSFTYNIACCLHDLGEKSVVIPLAKHQEFFSWLEINSDRQLVIIFGPGPGHPDEYDQSVIMIKKLLARPRLFLVGICLGHQLIWKAKGHDIVSAKTKIHGKVNKLSKSLFRDLGLVATSSYQRYNSLEVKIRKGLLRNSDQLHFHNASLLWSSFESGVSYQFHPESVGTSCPEIFFRPILNFLYNKNDECFTNSQRPLRSNFIEATSSK